MMVMMVVHFARLQERLYRIGLAGGVQTQFTASANALVRLDVRAGRHFLQVQGYRFIAFDTFERQGTCWFGHSEKNSGKTRILAFHAIPGTGGPSVVLHRPGPWRHAMLCRVKPGMASGHYIVTRCCIWSPHVNCRAAPALNRYRMAGVIVKERGPLWNNRNNQARKQCASGCRKNWRNGVRRPTRSKSAASWAGIW